MSGTRCYGCGQDRPVKYEAVYTPTNGEQGRSLVVCETCGQALEPETFNKLALEVLPSTGGTVTFVNHPADQVLRDGQLPENQ